MAFPVVILGIALSATVVATVIITAAVLIATVVLGVLLKPKNPVNASFLTALEQQLNPDAFRTMVFGQCPTGNDVRFWEVYGSTGFDQIIASSTHKMSEFDNFYVNGRLVTFAGSNSTGAATGRAAIGTFGTGDYSAADTGYSGALTKTNMNEGVSGSTISGTTGAGSLWTSSSSMTYCSFYRLKWNYSQKKLPSGIPSNTCNIGKGIPVYDPRKDSTVGGSGSHRANDNTTWDYFATDSNGIEIGRNNALQILTYLLGWYKPNVQTSVPMLLGGRGVDPLDIDYAQFIAAANECEAAKFYSDCTVSTGDDHNTNEGIIAAASQGLVIDNGGLWGFYPAVDDTGTIDVALNDDNIVGGVQWVPKTGISESFNSIGGHFIDNSPITVYQPQPYPTVLNATYLAQDNNMSKRITLDFSSVQDPTQAQVLARIALNKSRLTGQFSATFNYAAIKTKCYGIVTLSFAALGWVNKMFRVISYSLDPQGGVALILREENSLVYTGGTVTTYAPRSAGQVIDPTVGIALAGLTASATPVNSDGTTVVDGLNVSWTAPNNLVASIEVQFKQHSASVWTPYGTRIGADVANVVIPNLLISTSYDIQARTWSIYNIPGAWASITQSTGANTTATQNQIFNSGTDPSLSVTVNNGAIWNDTANGFTYTRVGGSWVQGASTNQVFTQGTDPTLTTTVINGAIWHNTTDGFTYTYASGWVQNASQNQTFTQGTDPAISVTVVNGALWADTSNNKLYMRIGGSWSLVANISASMADGDVIYDSIVPISSHAVPIPMNALGHVDIFVFGGGGGGSTVHGGGGSGYAYTHLFAVSPGTSILTVTVGAQGVSQNLSPAAPATPGSFSSVSASGLTTLVATGGGAATSSAAGAGGTGSGGTTTNTTGEAGDLGTIGNGGANLGTGGLGPTGGARQTSVGTAGNNPGGGASKSGGAQLGGWARVVILTRT